MRCPGADRSAGRLATALLIALLLTGCSDELSFQPASGDVASAPLESITRPAEQGDVHLVRMVQRGDLYAFEPAELTVSTGDVVRFVMTGSQPESVVFDPAATGPQIGDFVRAQGLHRGVLLTDSGQSYDVSFLDAPPGRYPFVSLPHADRGMRGAVIVEP